LEKRAQETRLGSTKVLTHVFPYPSSSARVLRKAKDGWKKRVRPKKWVIDKLEKFSLVLQNRSDIIGW
jgi:hypothetical protein